PPTGGTILRHRPGHATVRASLRRARSGALRRERQLALGERLADLARQHEADVLLDDFELRHVLGAAGAEELQQPLHQLLGCDRARRRRMMRAVSSTDSVVWVR